MTDLNKITGTVLVVDDDPQALQSLAEILTASDYKVQTACDAMTAFQAIQSNTPDIILLDIKLPDIDGFQVCRRLKEGDSCTDTPVIFISGLQDVSEKVKAFSAGGVDYITKPFEANEVLARVRCHLKMRELQEQLKLKNAELIEAKGDLERQVYKKTEELLQVNSDLLREVERGREYEASLKRSARALNTLSECNEVLVRATHENTLIKDVCRIIVDVGGYRLAWIGFAENDEGKSVRPAAYSGLEAGYLERLKLSWADTREGQGPTGTAIRTGKPCVIKNFYEDDRVAPWRDEAVRRGFLSSASIPLRDGDRVFGGINIYAPDIDSFDYTELYLMEKLAANLAYGIIALRRKVEHEKAKEELVRSHQQLRNLALHIEEVREEERISIARDIHDELGQLLTILKFDISWIRKSIKTRDEDIISRMDDAIEHVDSAITATQKISSELRPPILDDLGLIEAMNWYVRQFMKRTGINVTISVKTEHLNLDQGLATAVFRVLQESLTNIARHANASEVRIGFSVSDGKLFLGIIDNGKGIRDEDLNSPESFGLIGLRERVYSRKGSVSIKGIRGKGTVIEVVFPLASSLQRL